MNLLSFYQALYKDCKGWIEIRYIKPNSRTLVDWINLEVQMNPEVFPIQKIRENNENGYNVYHGACPRDKTIYGRRDLIKQVPALWCDIDFKDLDRGKESADAILNTLPEHITPSCILSSGNGYHCYWFLDKVFKLKTTDDINLIERTVKAIALKLEGDKKVTDIPRILRSPGTWNTKNPEHKKKAELIKFEPERRFSLETMTHFFRIDEELIKNTTPDEKKAFKELRDKDENWVEKVMDGVGEGQRDCSAIKLASYFLVAKKIPAAQVRKILQNWALRCSPPYPWNEIDRIMKSAKKYSQQQAIDSDAPRIIAIDTIDSDPKYYIIRLDTGTEFTVNHDVLNSWGKIQKAYLNAVNRSMATWMDSKGWHHYMDSHLRNTRYIDAPEDASDDFVVFSIIKDYIERQKDATNKAELKLGRPVTHKKDGKTRRYFSGTILSHYMEQLNKQIPQGELLRIIKKYGGGSDYVHVPCLKKTANLWYIVNEEDEEELED